MPSKYGFVTVGEEREEYERAEREREERRRTEMEERRKAADALFARANVIITNILMDFAWAREWDHPRVEYGDHAVILVGGRRRTTGVFLTTILKVSIPLTKDESRLNLMKPEDWVSGYDDNLDALVQKIANHTGVSTYLTYMVTPDVDHTAPSSGRRIPYESEGQKFEPQPLDDSMSHVV